MPISHLQKNKLAYYGCSFYFLVIYIMDIVLNVAANGSCSTIYARPNEQDLENISQVFVLIIWHHSGSPSLSVSYYPPVQHDNDLFVTFKSTMPFNEFHQRFALSEYNDPKKYNLLTHNCARAALYALELAGIGLSVPQLPFGPISNFSVIHIPVLTPLGLYALAKEHQIRLQPPLSLQRVFDQLYERLRMESRPAVLEQTSSIMAELAHRCKKRPHHAAYYAEALKGTESMLSGNGSEEQRNLYRAKILFFRHREKSPAVKKLHQFTNPAFALSIALSLLSYFTAESMGGDLANYASYIPLMVIWILIFQSVIQGNKWGARETRLSTAMNNLYNELSIVSETSLAGSTTLTNFQDDSHSRGFQRTAPVIPEYRAS